MRDTTVSLHLSKVVLFPGDSKSWEYPDEADIVWRWFIQILFRKIANLLPSIWEDIPANIFTLKNHLKSFPDTSKSHET